MRTKFASPTAVMAALRTHLIYHNFVMAMCRLCLYASTSVLHGFALDVRETFMTSARHVLELTAHLEVEPYAPSLYVSLIDSIQIAPAMNCS